MESTDATDTFLDIGDSATYNTVQHNVISIITKQLNSSVKNKKAQLSLTNPRDAKACQKLLQFDVLTTNVVADNTGLSSFV